MNAIRRLDLPERETGDGDNCCKNCKNYNNESCDRIGGIVSENNYCSDWESKDE